MREETSKLFNTFIAQNPQLMATNDQGVSVIPESESPRIYELFKKFLDQNHRDQKTKIVEYIDAETDSEDSETEDEDRDVPLYAMDSMTAKETGTELTGEDDFVAMFNAACDAVGIV